MPAAREHGQGQCNRGTISENDVLAAMEGFVLFPFPSLPSENNKFKQYDVHKLRPK